MLSSFADRHPRLYAILPFLALIAAVFTAYSNIYENKFLLDDLVFIVGNSFLKSWDSIGRIFTTDFGACCGLSIPMYRPLIHLLFLIVTQLFDQSEIAFHLLNVLLHVANTCLVFALGRRLGFHPLGAFLAALIWGMHPVHVEAITYMSSTTDPLYSLLCLTGVFILLPDFSLRRILTACPLFILALLTKEAAIMFPVLAMVTFYFTRGGNLQPQAYLRFWPLWLLAGLYILLRVYGLGLGITLETIADDPSLQSLDARFYTFLSTLPVILSLIFWPTGLHMDRFMPIHVAFGDTQVLIGSIIFLVALVLAFFGRSKQTIPLGWGLLWFAAAHFLNSGIFTQIYFIFTEHWLYLGLAGLMLGGFETAVRLGKRFQLQNYSQGIVVALLAVAAALGPTTLAQNRTWQDPISFNENIIKYNPNSSIGLKGLGAALLRANEDERALEILRRAIAIDTLSPDLYNNLGIALMKRQDAWSHTDEIKASFERAIQIDPNYYRAYYGLRDLYSSLGDFNTAANYMAQAIEAQQRLGIAPIEP